jgi:uncharacterized protein (TIGR04141 family)
MDDPALNAAPGYLPPIRTSSTGSTRHTAKGSTPLSHLFSRDVVSPQTILHGPHQVRERFAGEVRRLSKGQTRPVGYKPKKVVFAILIENGAELSIDTSYPFSQVTLPHVARVLGTYGIDVEVIGIPAA